MPSLIVEWILYERNGKKLFLVGNGNHKNSISCEKCLEAVPAGGVEAVELATRLSRQGW